MREQKYKDILAKYEESLSSNSDFKESEEKLSMTRELKFKDIQDSLTKEETQENDLTMTREMKFIDKIKEANEEYEEEDEEESPIDREKTLEESANIERELDEAIASEIQKKKNLQVKEVNEPKETKSKHPEDDIYLTTSFKPFKKRFRFRKVFKVLFILLILIGGIGALTYYVALPAYQKFMDSRPKMIFDHTVDYAFTNYQNFIDFLYDEENIVYSDINFKVDSNIDGLEEMNKNSYGFRMAFNVNEELMETFLYLQDDKDKYGFYKTEKEDSSYFRFSNSDTLLKQPLSDNRKESQKNFYEDLKSTLKDELLYKEDTNYALSKLQEITKEMLDKEYITSTKDEIEILEKKLSVTRNSYEIGKKEAEKLGKKFYELISEDKRLVKILAEMEETTEEEYLGQLEESINESYEDDYKFVINIYTVKGNQFIGLDIEENGFRNVYFYQNEGNFILYANLTEDSDCKEGKDCVASNRKIIEIEGQKKDTTTEVSIKYNSNLYAKLDVKEFSLEKIKFDYEIYDEEETSQGDIDLSMNNNRKEYTLKLGFKEEDEYLNVELFLGLKANEKFGIIDEANVQDYTNSEYEKEYKVFMKELDEKEMADNFLIWYTLLYEPEKVLIIFDSDSTPPSSDSENVQPSPAQTM